MEISITLIEDVKEDGMNRWRILLRKKITIAAIFATVLFYVFTG